MQKRTKIIATLGPASDSLQQIQSLIQAGVDVFRLNFSHGTHNYHLDVLQKIRQVEKEVKKPIGILQDISGPKIRVGELAEPFELQQNDTIEFSYEEIVGYKIKPHHYITSINQPSILKQLKIGDFIYLYDGMIQSIVESLTTSGVVVKVKNSGILTSKKGINFPNTSLGIEVITKKDKEDMLWGVQNKVDFMAISFVQNEKDMIQAREIVKSYGGNTQLLAKIEKFDAVENIDAILKASDGLMVARGDLGIEVPFHEVPSLQKMLIKKANALSKPVITATQMLLSMTQKDRATRAEISDVANAVLDGTDAVMLSEESAVGHNPTLAVETMFQTIVGVEKIYPYNKLSHYKIEDATDSINESAVKLCDDIKSSALISLTASGLSVRKIARYRPSQPIYSVAPNENVARVLTLCWGVAPTFIVDEHSLGQTMKQVIQQGLKKKILSLDKSYILTAGDPLGVVGSTNMIRILREYEMDFFRSLG